jgi:hypothetical protein
MTDHEDAEFEREHLPRMVAALAANPAFNTEDATWNDLVDGAVEMLIATRHRLETRATRE